MRGLKLGLAMLLLYIGFIMPIKVLAADTPMIKSVAPKTVTVGNTELRVRVRGKQKYKKGAMVLVNGQAVTTQLQNGTLLGFVPPEFLAQPGTVSIAVKAGTSVTSSSPLTVQAASDIMITAIRPRIVIAGSAASAFGVEVQGLNFNGKAVVRVGGSKTTTEVRRKGDFAFVIGTVDPREVNLTGSVPVQVENGDGTISNTFNIIIAAPGPNLDQIDPNLVTIGTKDTKLKLMGSNFDKTSMVFVNGQQLPATLKKGKKTTDIETLVPAAMFTQATQLLVKVVTPGVGDSDVLLLTVVPVTKSPIVLDLNPTNVLAGTKDFDLIVDGANLQNIKDVTINGAKVPKDNIMEIGRRSLKIMVKSKSVASPGKVDFQITTKDGTSGIASLIVEPAGNVTSLAGKVPGFVDGVGTSALFANPGQAILAPDGNVYIADQANHVIRRFNPQTGEVKTIAGDPMGNAGLVDTADIDKNNPTVRFNNPLGMAIDKQGIIYISDFGNNVIRRMRFDNQGNPIVDTIAGKIRMAKNDDGTKTPIGEIGFLDDVANRSTFSGPYGLAFDMDGNLLVADSSNNVIRKIIFVNGEAQSVTTLVGNGFPGVSDGVGNSVQLNKPIGLVMKDNQLFISDFGSNSVRKVDMTSLDTRVLVGLRRRIQSSALSQTNANFSTFGDGNKFFAVLNGPISSTFDDEGNLYILDFNRNRIRRVDLDGNVTTVAGNRRDFADGAAIPTAAFRDARHIMYIGNNQILIIDSGNERVRMLSLPK